MSDRKSAALALLLLLPAPTIGVVVAQRILPGAAGQTIYLVLKVYLITFPLVWWRLKDRQSWSHSPMRRGGLGVGLVTGLGIFSAIVAVYMVLGPSIIDPEKLHEMAARNGLDEKGRYLALVVGLTLVNSLLEEYVWRWFVFIKCEVLLGRGWAVVATAVGFTVHHVFALEAQFGWQVTVLGSAGVFVGSLCWSWLYFRYRSIWPSYASHILADLAIFGVGWRLLFS